MYRPRKLTTLGFWDIFMSLILMVFLEMMLRFWDKLEMLMQNLFQGYECKISRDEFTSDLIFKAGVLEINVKLLGINLGYGCKVSRNKFGIPNDSNF